MSFSDNFPNEKKEPFTKTSDPTPDYNCIAWAANVDDRFFWPSGYGFWPDDIPRKVTLDAFIKLYEKYGYETCEDGDYEEGFSKIVIFTKNGKPEHAARQVDEDTWTSKLGKAHDVTHTIEAMNGGHYGDASQYMKKRITRFQKRRLKLGPYYQ